MSDQADQLRKLVRETVEARPSLAPGLPIVVFSGGDEGVGTTSLALDASKELVQLGKSVLLVEANLHRPALAERYSVTSRLCLAEVLNGKVSVKEAIWPTPEGIQLLAAQPNSASSAELNRAAFGRFLSELRGLHAQADVVLVDAGSGMTPWMQSWWRAAHQSFLITTTDEESIKGAYASIKLASWGDVDGKLKLVINRSDNEDSALRIADRFVSTCRRFLGVNVGQATPLADAENFAVAYSRSTRLLATDIVSESLVISERMASNTPGNRLPSLPEKLDYSSNQVQHTDS